MNNTLVNHVALVQCINHANAGQKKKKKKVAVAWLLVRVSQKLLISGDFFFLKHSL